MEYIEGRKVILETLVGSWAYNLNTLFSDKDWKYFVLPTFEDLYMGRRFSTSSITPTFDYDVHDIRVLPELFWSANISFIAVLYSRERVYNNDLFWLFEYRDLLSAMNLPRFYSATMGTHYNKMSLLHKPTSNTQVLVDRFGWDTKQGCHALRCLYVLERYIRFDRSMRKALWFEDNDEQRTILISVKEGEVSLDLFNALVFEWMSDHKENVEKWYKSQTPDEALKEDIDSLMIKYIKEKMKSYWC